MTREYLHATFAFFVSLSITAMVYNYFLWHFFRGYNEVSNMFVLPVVGALVVANVGTAVAIWTYGQFRKQSGLTPTAFAFLLAALVVLCSPLFAPSIGRFANRNLWIHTPIVEAAQYGDAAVVMALLRNGADPNERQAALGTTPLHYMAYKDETDAVTLLLIKGADPNARANTSLETPLHWAVKARTNLETISTLIKYGAIPTLANWHGETPIDLTEIIPEPQASQIREALQPESG